MAELDDKEIELVIFKLEKKILLDDNQSNSVNNLLQKYSDELLKLNIKSIGAESKYPTKQHLVDETNLEIDALLTKKQKMKYDIIKSEWWSEIKMQEND
jgi:hypothetical protein